MTYVELHARSAFSFLRGASQPEELAVRAAELGLGGLTLCDRDGLYSAPRLLAAGREHGVRPIVGAELTLEDGVILPVLVATRTGYQNLSRLITRAKLRGSKTESPVRWNELAEFSDGLLALTGDAEGVLDPDRPDLSRERLERLVKTFGRSNVFVEIERHLIRGEERRQTFVRDVASTAGLLLIATNNVLLHERHRRPVQDMFTCLRHHTTLSKAGRLLAQNDERHLKDARTMRALFADLPEAVENTHRVADRIEFSLENLGYEFPKFPVPEGDTMDSFLRRVTFAGARARYGHLSPKVRRQIEFELALIAKLGFSGYFLIVWDLVNYCTESAILVQGRGSAANSAVCYSLGITACDPIACNLLFERFLSEGRKSWPDIDLDLPSGERREQVIQEVYRRYGKHGAAMTANVITYRGRSAMREIGKVLEFSEETISRFSSLFANGDFPHTMDLESQLTQAGVPRNHPQAAAAASLYRQIYGLPRHLGQHSGGMIICQNDLGAIVPIENASMPGRVVAQWDKDDCEDLGIIKVDLLGLGMMAAMQDTLEICRERGRPVDLATIPKDDPATYALLQAADTIGTFQVESRAQMATLPRLKPKCFYDVVVEVALIRPGPIQGQMVHPYLSRRDGLEPVTYFDERLIPVLERTLGVPLFQEQLLKMSMVMADFSGSEAEELRRALSFHRSQERMSKVCVKLLANMKAKGVPQDVCDKIVQSVQSFAVYGFPESHAISFALIAYASCWLKVHRAPEFYCGILNNQPMGFYSSATLIRDAKSHGVQVRPVLATTSDWACRVEDDGSLRLGLCLVRGLDRATGERLVTERTRQPFASLEDFRLRVRPEKPTLRTLARIGALNGLVEHRRDGLWKVEAPLHPDELPLFADQTNSAPLAPMNPAERLQADFAGTGVTTGPHPMALLRPSIPDIIPAAELFDHPDGALVDIGGMVICRQRPGTGKGVVFISLEDETGVSNAILYAAFFEKHRLLVTQEPFLRITGKLQIHQGTAHVIAQSITRLDRHLPAPASHDFH
ncbi:MAG: error-prone DNA polymerase [Terrimicrobiaceae bacterium]|nr:error-prone DNA polymerase [Terrimicrobiaceae bacterium]